MSKTFFDHFDCRTLSDDLIILSVDNSVTCQDGMWILFAGISGIGLLVVSFGVPLLLLYIMHRAMQEKLREIRRREKRAVVAFNEFGRQFDYVVCCSSHAIELTVPSTTFTTSIMETVCLGRQL